MTDRTPPDRTEAPGQDATVRLDRRLTEVIVPTRAPHGAADDATAAAEPVAPAGDGAPPARADHTVDLRKRDDETVRVDRELPASWNPSPPPGQPTPPPAPIPGSPWSAQPAPSPWAAQPSPPAWSAQPGPTPWPATRAMSQPPGMQPPGMQPSGMPAPGMPASGMPPGMPPPGTPPLPPPRGRGPGPLIVFGILAALIIAGGAWALISLAAGSSPFGPQTADPRADPPISTDGADPADPILPLPPTATPGPDSGSPTDGPSGQVVVRWNLSGVAYQATVTTVGSTGNAVVSYVDPDTNQVRTIRQDLTLLSSGTRRAYVGSDPVEADTGSPAAGYAPDVFMLAENGQGQVYIDEVCDTTQVCSPATME